MCRTPTTGIPWYLLMINGYCLQPNIAILLASISCLLLANFASAETLTVTDSAGRTVSLDKPATRIIALAPHIVENVYSAGAGEKLVGVVTFSDYPPAAKELPIVGGYVSFSLEKIASLRPDLVITWAEGDGAEAAKPFERLGIPVYVDEPRELTEVADSVRNIGTLAGTSEIANPAVNAFLADLTELRKTYSHQQAVTVLYQVWDTPLMTINKDHLINAVIELCGGENIFADAPVITPKISLESIISQDPAVIIAGGMGEDRPDWLNNWRGYPRLSAVVAENLYFIPPSLLQRHTLRILQGAEQMCHSLQQARAKLTD